MEPLPAQPAFVPFSVETARYLTKGRRSMEAAQGKAAAADVRESNPAATTAEEFTNAIERTARASIRAAGFGAREIEDRQRWWQIGLLVMLAASQVRRFWVAGRLRP